MGGFLGVPLGRRQPSGVPCFSASSSWCSCSSGRTTPSTTWPRCEPPRPSTTASRCCTSSRCCISTPSWRSTTGCTPILCSGGWPGTTTTTCTSLSRLAWWPGSGGGAPSITGPCARPSCSSTSSASSCSGCGRWPRPGCCRASITTTSWPSPMPSGAGTRGSWPRRPTSSPPCRRCTSAGRCGRPSPCGGCCAATAPPCSCGSTR